MLEDLYCLERVINLDLVIGKCVWGFNWAAVSCCASLQWKFSYLNFCLQDSPANLNLHNETQYQESYWQLRDILKWPASTWTCVRVHFFLGCESSGVHIWSCLPTCAKVHTSSPSDLQMEAFTFYRLLTLMTWQFQWAEKMTDQLPIIVGDGSSVGWGVKGCPWRSANQLWMGQEGLGLRHGQVLQGMIRETRCPGGCCLIKACILD